MNSAFTDYEVEVLGILLRQSDLFQNLRCAIRKSKSIDVRYTGYGFFITATNPSFGIERRIYSDLLIQAKADGATAGFIVFLENSELTLETYPLDSIPLPSNFRERQVVIEHSNTAEQDAAANP